MKINDQKITPAFCREKTLAFLPKTAGEAAIIQKHFFKMGYAWKTGGTALQHLNACVTHGIVIMNNTLYTSPYELTNLSNVHLCTVEHLADNYVSPAALFNSLAQRLSALEELLKPQKLDKPVMKKPGDGSP